ncbi:MAG: TIM barrel protein [Candidatus Hodarchaeales archaeon]|jgi:hypothetical protein
MTFKTGMTIHGMGEMKPSAALKMASIFSLEHIEFHESVFSDLRNVKDNLPTSQTAIHFPFVPDYDFDLSSDSKNADRLIKSIQEAKNDLNIIGVIVHPPDILNENFYERLSQLPFPMLENLPNQSWEEFLIFRDEVKANMTNSFGYCFDIPHSFITNGEKFLDIPEVILSSLKRKTGYIHLSGGDREKDQHYPLITDGNLPFRTVKQFLKEIRYSGTINLEIVPRTFKDIPKMFKSISIMFNVAGKRSKSFKTRIKIPLFNYKLKNQSKQIDADLEPIRAHYED